MGLDGDPREAAIRMMMDARFLLAELDCLRAASRRQAELIENLEGEQRSLDLAARLLKTLNEDQANHLASLRQREKTYMDALGLAAETLRLVLDRDNSEAYHTALERVQSLLAITPEMQGPQDSRDDGSGFE
jgi:hypothetical protein